MRESSTFFSLLKTIRFLPLFICQFFAGFNDTLIRASFGTMVAYMSTDLSTINRSIIMSLALGLYTLPCILFSAIAGKLADKYNKSVFIQYIRLFSIVIVFMGATGFIFHNYIMLLGAIFLCGIQAALFGPVKYSILPDHLRKDELLLGNGLIEASTFIAILIGTIIGGVSISTNSGGIAITNIILITTALLSIISSFFIPSTVQAAPHIRIKTQINLFTEIKECINYARKDRDIFLAILGISWGWLIGGAIVSQMPSFTRDTLSGDNSVFILLISIFCIGTGVGSVACNRLLNSRVETHYVPISMFAMTFFIFCLWITSTYFQDRTYLGGIHYFLSSLKGICVCIEAFMVAAFGGVYIVPLYAFLQVKADKPHLSRIIAANNILSSIFIVVGSLIIMFLLSTGIKVSNLILTIALANFFTAVYICKILPDTIIKAVFQTLFRLIYRVKVIGLENYYKAGNKVLIIANHASFLDPALLGAFLPDRMVFAIDTFHSRAFWINPFLSYLRAFPVDPSNPMAAKTLIEQLRLKKPVVIFPEGRITVTGSLMKIYEGPGLVADKAGAKLLPIRIDGPQYSPFSRLHGKVKLKLFPKITITILEPQTIEVPDHLQGRQRRNVIGKYLYDIMSNMMFKETHSNQTLFESLIEATNQYGKKHTILEDADHNRLSYKKITLGSFVLGKKLAKYTSPTEYVGVLMPNVVSAAVLFFATQVYGRIPAMINYSTGIRNILSCCKAAEIKVVITAHKFIEKANFYYIVDALQENGIKVIFLEDIRTSVTLLDKIYGLIATAYPLAFYKRLNYSNPQTVDLPAVVLFTSGSEGTPKGVVLSHINIQSNIKQAACRVDFSPHDKVFNCLPIFHSFGLTGGFLLPILSGVRTFLYLSPLHYRIIPETVYGCNATILFGTDTFLNGFAKHAHPYDFYSIRYIFAGAEKLREETKKIYAEKFGIRVLEGYGATEASPIISINTPMHYKAGTVGRLVPNINYYLEKIEGIDNGGRLIINGPNIMLGYLKEDKPGIIQKPQHKIEGKIRRKWYDTGDIAKIDDDGFITILGRAKRFAKIAGEMISLTVIEENIIKLYPQNLAAVISLPDPKKGEVIILFINKQNVTREDIHTFFKAAGLSELFVPKIVNYLENIPVLATGKVNYVALKETAAELDLSVISDNGD